MTEKHGTGSFHLGSKGEGLVYVSKRLVAELPFSDKDQLRITIHDNRLIIEKL